MAQLNYQVNEDDLMQDRELLDAGEYVAVVVESDIKETKARDGKYVALTFQITSGPRTGSQIWVNLNIENPNEKAVEIAQRELNSIGMAVGVISLKDTDQLHGIECGIKVGIEKGKGEYPDKNKILAYTRIGAVKFQTPTAQEPGKQTASWKKR